MVFAVHAARLDWPADVVWPIVEFEGGKVLMPIPGQMLSVTFEGKGPGARRIFAIDEERLGGGHIVEELVSVDEAQRSYVYRIADNGPLPWTGYIGEIGVTPCGPDACAIRLSAELTPLGVSDEEARHIYLTHCHMDVTRIEEYLAQRQS